MRPGKRSRAYWAPGRRRLIASRSSLWARCAEATTFSIRILKRRLPESDGGKLALGGSSGRLGAGVHRGDRRRRIGAGSGDWPQRGRCPNMRRRAQPRYSPSHIHLRAMGASRDWDPRGYGGRATLPSEVTESFCPTVQAGRTGGDELAGDGADGAVGAAPPARRGGRSKIAFSILCRTSGGRGARLWTAFMCSSIRGIRSAGVSPVCTYPHFCPTSLHRNLLGICFPPERWAREGKGAQSLAGAVRSIRTIWMRLPRAAPAPRLLVALVPRFLTRWGRPL